MKTKLFFALFIFVFIAGTAFAGPYAPAAGVDLDAIGVMNANAVPIPGAIWLIGSGLLCMLGLRKKYKP